MSEETTVDVDFIQSPYDLVPLRGAPWYGMYFGRRSSEQTVAGGSSSARAGAGSERAQEQSGQDPQSDLGLDSGPTAPVLSDLAAGPVPEPGAWLMMIGGIGLTGAVLRRRRRRAA